MVSTKNVLSGEEVVEVIHYHTITYAGKTNSGIIKRILEENNVPDSATINSSGSDLEIEWETR